MPHTFTTTQQRIGYSVSNFKTEFALRLSRCCKGVPCHYEFFANSGRIGRSHYIRLKQQVNSMYQKEKTL